jgi:hypothetical protein
MSLLALAIAGEIRSADAEAKRLASAGLLPDALRAAIHRAEDCLADLERAERLLDSERAAAEAARAALDRALQLAEIAAEQQRRADEAAAPAAPAAPMCRDWRDIAEDRAAQRSKAAAARAAKKGGRQ